MLLVLSSIPNRVGFLYNVTFPSLLFNSVVTVERLLGKLFLTSLLYKFLEAEHL